MKTKNDLMGAKVHMQFHVIERKWRWRRMQQKNVPNYAKYLRNQSLLFCSFSCDRRSRLRAWRIGAQFNCHLCIFVWYSIEGLHFEIFVCIIRDCAGYELCSLLSTDVIALFWLEHNPSHGLQCTSKHTHLVHEMNIFFVSRFLLHFIPFDTW